jgi:LL-diaminopimelate aminotransferase
MAMDYQKLYADRIGGEKFGTDTAIYKFEKIKRARKAFEAAHPEIPVINVGVGEHDGLQPELMSEVIARETREKRNKGYPDNGIIELQRAAVRHTNRTFRTNIPEADADKWAIHGMGSKNILALLPAGFINPGDTTLMTVPGYPVAGTWTRYFGGKVVNLPLHESNDFLPDLNEVDKIVPILNKVSKVKLMVVNYPNNPTGADGNREFYGDLARLANKYGFVVAQDGAYAGLEFGREPTSILQAEGGLECGLMIYSMSKAFNGIGRRIGIMVGNPKLIAAHANVKDNSDSGQDSAIQRAAAEALEHPEYTRQIASKYERRLGRLVDILNQNGFNAKMPAGSFFQYVRAPTGTRNGDTFKNAEEATKYMLEQHGVSTVPWDDVGSYLRFSATFDAGKDYNVLAGNPEADEVVLTELNKRLGNMQLKFD